MWAAAMESMAINSFRRWRAVSCGLDFDFVRGNAVFLAVEAFE
jgi:hypothetical protein